MRWKPVIIFAAFRWILDHADEPVDRDMSVTCMPFSSRAPDRSPTRFSTWAATRLGRTLSAILSLRQGPRCRRMFPNLWTGCLICARNLRTSHIRSPVSIGRLRRFTHFRTATVESDGLSCSRSFCVSMRCLSLSMTRIVRSTSMASVSFRTSQDGWLIRFYRTGPLPVACSENGCRGIALHVP